MCENWNAECVKLDVIRTPVSQHERPDLSSVQRCSAQSSRVPGTRRSSSCLLLSRREHYVLEGNVIPCGRRRRQAVLPSRAASSAARASATCSSNLCERRVWSCASPRSCDGPPPPAGTGVRPRAHVPSPARGNLIAPCRQHRLREVSFRGKGARMLRAGVRGASCTRVGMSLTLDKPEVPISAQQYRVTGCSSNLPHRVSNLCLQFLDRSG